MTTVNVYLTFDGNCLEAFKFYQSVFGGEFGYVGRFGDMPEGEGIPPVEESMKDKIMHISLPISKETTLMGSDTSNIWAPNYKVGTNFSLSINTDSTENADRLFKKLAEGGKISMPMAKTFWESYFGMLTDKFGIAWQINCELASHKAFEKENKAKN